MKDSLKNGIGILLTNTGTPNSPSISDVRAYLKSFLSDPHVVQLPSFLWKPLLNTVILPSRASYAAKLYQKIWTSEGSPLRSHMLRLSVKLEHYLVKKMNSRIFVEAGMHYGKPSISEGVMSLLAKDIEQLIFLPLFPQYSRSTTETAREQIKHALPKQLKISYSFMEHYAEHPAYIQALVQQIKKYHQQDHYLLFSFHGLPKRFADQGDPYPLLCQQSAKLSAQALDLSAESWSLSYQSRFGYAKWLSPYTFDSLRQIARRGISQVSVVCPGFSVDCLETLEEIQIRGKEIFLKEGGKAFHYIPALNASELHVEALGALVKNKIEDFQHSDAPLKENLAKDS